MGRGGREEGGGGRRSMGEIRIQVRHLQDLITQTQQDKHTHTQTTHMGREGMRDNTREEDKDQE